MPPSRWRICRFWHLLVVLFILWLNRKGWARPMLVALVYFLVLLFPVLGFFNVYFFRYSFVADHFQYLAGIGPLTLAAAGITLAFKNQTRSQAGVWRGLAADAGRVDVATGRDLPEPGNPLADDAGQKPGLLDGPQQSGSFA